MDISDTYNPALDAGMHLLASGTDLDNIRHSLESKKFTPEEIEEAMAVLKKQWYAKRHRRGMNNLLIGSVLLVLGCIVAVIMHDNTTFFRIALYGPSLVGCVIVCWGLIDVIGW